MLTWTHMHTKTLTYSCTCASAHSPTHMIRHCTDKYTYAQKCSEHPIKKQPLFNLNLQLLYLKLGTRSLDSVDMYSRTRVGLSLANFRSFRLCSFTLRSTLNFCFKVTLLVLDSRSGTRNIQHLVSFVSFLSQREKGGKDDGKGENAKQKPKKINALQNIESKQ